MYIDKLFYLYSFYFEIYCSVVYVSNVNKNFYIVIVIIWVDWKLDVVWWYVVEYYLFFLGVIFKGSWNKENK